MEKNQISSVKVEEVIAIRTVTGDGAEKSPYTAVIQYWTKSGKMIGQLRDFLNRFQIMFTFQIENDSRHSYIYAFF